MPTFSIRNWESFQHYRDRDPKWIKLYPRLLRDPHFIALPDASKFHLIGLFMVAAENRNKILADPAYLKSVLHASTQVDLSKLKHFLDFCEIPYQMVQNASLEESRGEESRGDSCVCFEKFWTAYPRKIGKRAAQAKWKTMKLNPLTDQILRAVEAQKKTESWRKDNGQFIPHPATWLNRGSWDDEIDVDTSGVSETELEAEIARRKLEMGWKS